MRAAAASRDEKSLREGKCAAMRESQRLVVAVANAMPSQKPRRVDSLVALHTLAPLIFFRPRPGLLAARALFARLRERRGLL
jgi:hypothetical protein